MPIRIAPDGYRYVTKTSRVRGMVTSVLRSRLEIGPATIYDFQLAITPTQADTNLRNMERRGEVRRIVVGIPNVRHAVWAKAR